MENIEPNSPEEVVKQFNLGFPDRHTLACGFARRVNSTLKYIIPWLSDMILRNLYDYRRFQAGIGEIGLDLPISDSRATLIRIDVPAYYFLQDYEKNLPITRVFNLGRRLYLEAIELCEDRCKIAVDWYTPYLEPFGRMLEEELIFCWPDSPRRGTTLSTNPSALPIAQELDKKASSQYRYGIAAQVGTPTSANPQQEMRDKEICRLRFEEQKTYKEIVAEIKRQGYTIQQERVEQICRADQRYKSMSQRIA